MKKTTTFFVGFISGAIIAALILFVTSPAILLKENKSPYAYEESLKKFEQAVIDGGWKIPVTHDLQATLIKNGKKNINPVTVFELCNPDLAASILETDDERVVSNMMPCRVAIYEKSDGSVYYSRMNSGLISKSMGKVSRKQMKKAFEDTEKFLMVLSEDGEIAGQ